MACEICCRDPVTVGEKACDLTCGIPVAKTTQVTEWKGVFDCILEPRRAFVHCFEVVRVFPAGKWTTGLGVNKTLTVDAGAMDCGPR